ncbi:MAG: hypothetical protein QXN96_06320 [Candidatus Bathyarchaeia archaeon]
MIGRECISINQIEEKINQVFEQLRKDKRLVQYIDGTLPIPQSYRGSGSIKLIVLGQDPTIKDPAGRKAIRTVLNLDRYGSVRAYLEDLCKGLGIRLTENVYATNLYKNFFVRPPTQILEIDIFQEFRDFWLPVLEEELKEFVGIPVITLGEPLLRTLVLETASTKVRDYWGYTPEPKIDGGRPFKYVRAADNRLKRSIFPFPHQPSLRKQFYKVRMSKYVSFMRSVAFS